MMKRFGSIALLVLLALVAATAALAPPVSAQAKLPATLLLNFYTYGEHAGLAYGVVKGIYAEEGIDLTLKEGAGSGATVNAIIGDSARFGYADAGAAARAITKNAPLKNIGNYVQTSPFSIIFFADKNFKSIKDLVGKKVSFTAGDALHQAWPALLKVNGVERSQVQEVLLAAAAKQTAVMTGAVDAMGGYYTTQAGAIERETNKKVTYLRYADFGVNALTDGMFVNTKYLTAAERPLNCKMMKATARAWTAAGKDPDGAVEALHQLFPNTNKGAKDLTKKQWVDSYDLLYTKATNGKTAGWMATEDWNILLKQLTEYGGMENPRQATDYFTNEFFDCK
jgi:NitT/TauT family transport system substrate-binding protein